MTKELLVYFVGEKQESVLFLAVGVLAIGVAAWLWTTDHRFRLMAVPLVVVALMQIVVGFTIYARTDAQVQSLSVLQKNEPVQFQVEEIDRMQTVMTNFKIYKTIEIVLLVFALALIAFVSKSDAAVGIGLGLLVQAAFTLALDLFAEARGEAYLAALTAFNPLN
jgi:NADH:ubiquinone oxidoreductase subunit K